jgi:hypothetical protein
VSESERRVIVFRNTKVLVVDFEKKKLESVEEVRNEWEVADPGDGKDEGDEEHGDDGE